jgi:ABC-type phosphate transport system substrate-binding protein
LLKPLIQACSSKNAGVNFEVGKPLGSSGGIKAALAGKVDIAIGSNRLGFEEIA